MFLRAVLRKPLVDLKGGVARERLAVGSAQVVSAMVLVGLLSTLSLIAAFVTGGFAINSTLSLVLLGQPALAAIH